MTFFQGKKGKSKSYAELGAGYDENDPFIDNTEAVSFNIMFSLFSVQEVFYAWSVFQL